VSIKARPFQASCASQHPVPGCIRRFAQASAFGVLLMVLDEAGWDLESPAADDVSHIGLLRIRHLCD